MDTSFRDRRLAERMKDPVFRAEYERAAAEVATRKGAPPLTITEVRNRLTDAGLRAGRGSIQGDFDAARNAGLITQAEYEAGVAEEIRKWGGNARRPSDFIRDRPLRPPYTGD